MVTFIKLTISTIMVTFKITISTIIVTFIFSPDHVNNYCHFDVVHKSGQLHYNMYYVCIVCLYYSVYKVDYRGAAAPKDKFNFFSSYTPKFQKGGKKHNFMQVFYETKGCFFLNHKIIHFPGYPLPN